MLSLAKRVIRAPERIGAILVVAFMSAGCGAVRNKAECRLPSLPAGEVTRVALGFLATRDIDPEFLRTGEMRVVELGCRYEFELSEKLESFGQSVFAEVSRERKVTNWY